MLLLEKFAVFMLIIGSVLASPVVNADAMAEQLEIIRAELEQGDSGKARELLRDLRNQHFAGYRIEGKTCRNHPAFILMVATEAKLRARQTELAGNYLQQLQCLANIQGNRQNPARFRQIINNYRVFTPRAVHECPQGLGETQLNNAREVGKKGQQQQAITETLRASCLLGQQHPAITKLLAGLSRQMPSSGQVPKQTSASRDDTGKIRPQEPIQDQVIDTRTDSPDSNWVIPVLAAAILMAGILVFIVRKKRKASVFISYRRRDSAGWSQTIHDKLASELGYEAIFMDLHDIPPGAYFVQHLDQTLDDVRTVILVIGPNWEGGERIHNDGDWVRQEVVYAMNSGKKVIPVLVDQRQMPSTDSLPEDLQPMTLLNAITLHSDQLEAGIRRLLKAIK